MTITLTPLEALGVISLFIFILIDDLCVICELAKLHKKIKELEKKLSEVRE